MNHEGHSEVPASLARRADLPVRVRGVLDGLRQRTVAYFSEPIERTLDDLERELFKLADRSRNNTGQQQWFEALHQTRLGRVGVAPRFQQHAESRLAEMRSAPQAPMPAPLREKTRARIALELVDIAAQEEDLALWEIEGKAEVRNSQSLYALAWRLGVLGATSAWPNETLPLGPVQLAQAFQYALRVLDLSLEYRILAYRLFDRAAMLAVGPFYESLNMYLIAQRILPNLQAPRGQRRGDTADIARDNVVEAPSTELSRAARSHAAREQSDASDPQLLNTLRDLLSEHTPPSGQRRGDTADVPRDNFVEAPSTELSRAAESPAARDQSVASDPQLFNTLRDLLSEHRRLDGDMRNLLSERRRLDGDIGPRPDKHVFHASSDDLQTVLGALQHGSARAPSGTYDSEHFKNTLQVKLRRAGPVGHPLRLSEEDSDTVDLVGMLFGYINQNVQEGSGARGLLNKLHVPVLRVALNDKTFFTRRDHPAREFLNTIAETGARWSDDSDSDPELVKKMQLVVDHVNADFNGDLGVFEKLLRDLGGHMQLFARRAELAERHHIDAAKGRDKLDIARRSARAVIARVVQHNAPTPLVRSLLEQAWTDALALSALREGEGSDEFKRRVAVAETLSRLGAEPSAPETVDATLHADLDAGLRQVGLHDDDVHGVLESLLPPPGRARAITPEKLNRIDTALKGKARLGEALEKAVLAPTHRATLPLNAAENDMLERLRKVPFGTWFDFVTNQQGNLARRKLAWFSTVTGRCLFVNQRGARAQDCTLDQLARDMARGQARVAGAEHASLIDRAWKAITDTLRPHAVGATTVNA
jgi:hypothetical protein